MGSPDGATGVDIKTRGRNSPALSARSAEIKRTRVGSSLPLSSSLPTSPTGSISGFDPRPLDDVSSITSPDRPWIRDLGKYDPLTIADQIDEVIRSERTIHRNGLNQIKIVCSGGDDANLLISYHELKMAGYKAFLPISMIRKKATIRDIDPRHSPTTILNRLDSRSRDIVTAVIRRTNNEGALSETIELTLETTTIPSSLLSSFSLEFLLAVYNRMFRESSFPESWRNTLVVFIPKTGTGKFRPISLIRLLSVLGFALLTGVAYVCTRSLNSYILPLRKAWWFA